MKHIRQKILILAVSMLTMTNFIQNAAAESKVELDKKVVTATRTEVSLMDAPGAVTVITAEDIKDIPANDILDIIRETAGVSLIGRGVGGRNVISIRGLNSWHSLILIDGKRLAASDPVFGHSDFEQNWVSIESIERIEVVRGPLSALYGSEAIGGVINIITRKTTDEWQGSAKIGGGFRDDGNGGENRNIGIQAGGPIVKDKLGLSLTAEYIEDKDTPDKDDPVVSELEGKEVFSVGGKLTFLLNPNHTLEATAGIVRDDRERDASSRGRNYLGVCDLDKKNYSVSWHGTTGNFNSSVSAYRSDIDKVKRNLYEDDSRTENPEQLINDVLDAQTTFPVGFNLITMGGELRNEELESESMDKGKDDVTHGALFFQDEMALLNERLLLTPGIRWDDHESFGSEFSPRLYALYKLTDQVNLKAGYGHAFRAPTIKQVSEGYHAASGPHEFFGNPNLKPEKSDSYELGAEYHDDGFFLRVLYFFNDIEDLIDWDQIDQVGSIRHFLAANVAKAETQGIETELGWTLPQGFDLTCSYTYLDAKDAENDQRLDEKPRHAINGKLRYRANRIGLSATLRSQYIAGQVLYNDDDELEGAPDYALWHFSLRKTFFNSLEAQIGVDNIGDVRLADRSNLFAYEERGRFYYANLRYQF